MRALIEPDDSYNRGLLRNVHPPDWVNPTPAGRYNLVVIGAGTAGLVTAAVAAALGAKVALIERHLMGGDCLNVGCVPSKALVRASRAWSDVRHADRFGVHVDGSIKHDFASVMERMRKLRAQISHNDSADRFKKLGVDVFIGAGEFVGPHAVKVQQRTLNFKKAAICTGARAAAPAIAGLQETGYLTNETVFELTDLPRRLAVIGGGPIGCEMAQAFSRFGSDVHLLEQMDRLLSREDADAVDIVQSQMANDGVVVLLGTKIIRVERRGREKVVHYQNNARTEKLVVDDILVGIGRAPNVEALGLDTIGVEYNTTSGIKVDAKLQTTQSHIYAAGDVCFPFKFTHTADAMAQIVIQNALFPHPLGLGYASTDSLIIPWCTYTDPEIAHVGMYAAEAEHKGIKVETFSVPLAKVDRAILDGEEHGFARAHVKKGTDQLIGATIVSAHAGDMISELTLLMKAKKGLNTIAGTIYPYPTQTELVKKLANEWRKTTLTAAKQKLLSKWFEWTR